MDTLETNATTETQQTETTQPGAAETGGAANASTDTGGNTEQMNAFQKFLSSLTGGKKAETAGSEQNESGATGNDGAGNDTGTFTQADIDAALEAAKKKWEEDAAESERLKKLSPEEKAKEEQAKKDAELAGLKKTLAEKELKDKALAKLTDDGYSPKLADIIKYDDQESMEKSLETVTEVVKEAVEAAVKQKLRGKTPAGLGGAAGAENLIKDQIAKNIRGGLS